MTAERSTGRNPELHGRLLGTAMSKNDDEILIYSPKGVHDQLYVSRADSTNWFLVIPFSTLVRLGKGDFGDGYNKLIREAIPSCSFPPVSVDSFGLISELGEYIENKLQDQ